MKTKEHSRKAKVNVMERFVVGLVAQLKSWSKYNWKCVTIKIAVQQPSLTEYLVGFYFVQQIKEG